MTFFTGINQSRFKMSTGRGRGSKQDNGCKAAILSSTCTWPVRWIDPSPGFHDKQQEEHLRDVNHVNVCVPRPVLPTRISHMPVGVNPVVCFGLFGVPSSHPEFTSGPTLT